eukprot:tig00020614_g12147.t1
MKPRRTDPRHSSAPPWRALSASRTARAQQSWSSGRPARAPLAPLIVLLCALTADAVFNVHTFKDDSRKVIWLDSFEFTSEGGHIFMRADNVSVYGGIAGLRRLGFIFVRSSTLSSSGSTPSLPPRDPIATIEKVCPFDSPERKFSLMWNEEELKATGAVAEGQRLFPAQEKRIEVTQEEAGGYSLFFAMCREEDRSTVSFRLELQMLNGFDHLPAGDVPLEGTYMFVFCLYTIAAGFWLSHCARQLSACTRLHVLMTALIADATAGRLLASVAYNVVKTTGRRNAVHVWLFACQLAEWTLLQLAVVVLAIGYEQGRPTLAVEWQRRAALSLVPAQAFTRFWALRHPHVWVWRAASFGCLCAAMLVLHRAVRFLRQLYSSDAAAGTHLARVEILRTAFALYLFLSPVLELAFSASFRVRFLSVLTLECSALALYCAAGYLFRPGGASGAADLI